MKSLVSHNMRTDREQEFRIRHDNPAAVLETCFAPRTPDADEGDGWIIVPVSRWRERMGEFLIFDTYDISDGPIARIEIPFLMGWTPHGHWMDFR
jgi:carotenoid cleavage dioxygenase